MASPRAQEQKLRAAAKRQGYALRSSRRRDPHALDYGIWTLSTRRGKVVVRGDLDAIERYLYRSA
jgi:hypothetical protein